MQTFETGTVFLGFTKQMKCQNCNNKTVHILRQAYFKQTVFFVPISNSNREVILVCPVCEKSENILNSKFWGSKEKLNYVNELLDSGKEETKRQYQLLDLKEREKLLKRLNALEAHAVVRYIGA
jgi:transcription elongation factor Elf1